MKGAGGFRPRFLTRGLLMEDATLRQFFKVIIAEAGLFMLLFF